jgi:hypothetical protein
MSSAAPDDLRTRFLGWQCRLRQIAMRQDGGRPSPGMRPRIVTRQGKEIAGALTVLLVPKEPAESTAFFRFQVEKTFDPQEIYERGLGFLQGDFFQQPDTFDDRLVAVLPEDAPLSTALIAAKSCVLEFDQFRQTFRLPCKLRELGGGDEARDAAIWHNRIFNPTLPDSVRVIAFQPDWAAASAAP